VALLLALPSEGVLDQSGQLIRSAVDGFIQGRSMVRDRDGLAPFDAGFQHATHGVMTDLLVTIFVAKMDFHSRDMIAEKTQGALHDVTKLSGQRLMSFDVRPAVYLYLHGVLLAVKSETIETGCARPTRPVIRW
jgi:hypothetical protein